jgi:nucleoid-associated protein YgaU
MAIRPPAVVGSHAQPTTRATTSIGVPPAGRVRIAAVGATQFVEAWVDGPVLPTESGYGGWTVVETEGGKGTLEFSGTEPQRWTLPLKLDSWSTGEDLQDVWDLLMSLASEQGFDPPPQVRLAGTIPPDLSARAWVIEKPVPGSERLINEGNQLLRAEVTLNLIEASFSRNIASPLKQAQRAAKGAHSSRTIRARAGDTLVSIAARELGNPEKWRDISKLNGGLQPDNVKAGQKIKLP